MAKAKHILVFFVDDLRPELNCFGKQKLHTPNIDRLAARSTLFERAYCNFPQCMPSRTSMMCGKRPPAFCQWVAELNSRGEPSLPRFMKDRGYTTVSCGKVYHKALDDAIAWTELHKDTFWEPYPGQTDQNMHDYQLPENQRKSQEKFRIGFPAFRDVWESLPPLSECADAPDAGYVDAKVATRAIDVIERHGGKKQPLFLCAGFFRPHLPWVAPQWAWDLYDRDSIDLADNPFFPENGIGKSDLCDFMHYGDEEAQALFSDVGRYRDDDFPVLSEAKQRECIHGYWASVSFMDAQVGRVMNKLEEMGILDETAVFLWGDNGWHLGEHKLWSKVTHFEESTRVPLLVSVPGVTEGERASAIVEIVDIYPTVCELIGAEAPEHLEGETLPMGPTARSAITAKPAAVTCWNGYTIVTDRYRLTWYPKAEKQEDLSMIAGRGQWELFDHHKDPQENRNVAGDAAYTDILAGLKMELLTRFPAVDAKGNAPSVQ